MEASECPLEIDVEEARRLLVERPDSVSLIDVREAFEVELCRIEGSEHIPMRQIPEKVGALPHDKHLLIHCHHGGRSLRVTEYLRAQGYTQVSNVAGGIDDWAQRIEPEMKRY